MKNATVKWFNAQKGYGFLIDSETKEDVFCHYSQLQMDGFKSLHEDDIITYELEASDDGSRRQQAINVKPLLTMRMIKDSLKEKDLYVHVRNIEDASGQNTYMVSDQNNVLQSSEQGMSFLELAAYAGFEVHQISA